MLTYCIYDAHSQRITPAAIWRYSHTSPPQSYCKQPTDQRNAITGGAATSGCRLRVYIVNF